MCLVDACFFVHILHKKIKARTSVIRALSFNLVRGMRIELTHLAIYAPQTYASTSSAIAANALNKYKRFYLY